MQKINRIVSIFLVLCLLAITGANVRIAMVVFAEETEKNELTTINEEKIYEFDNSELDVRVIQQIRDEQTTVFTGKIKDYDNGKWIHLDFSEVQFFTVFNWDGPNDEYVCIIPLRANAEQTEDNISVDETNIMSVETSDNTREYKIKQAVIKNSNDVITHDCTTNGKLDSVTLIKNTTETKPAKLYAALYNGSVLENLKLVDVQGNGTAGSEIVCNVNLPFETVTENHHVRIMLWDGDNNMHPLVDPYDTNIITTGYVYNNTIQTPNQCDEYSFTVPSDGYYSISVPSGSNIQGSLIYGVDGIEIASKNNMSSSDKITHYLLKNEVYKIRFTSLALSTYSFIINPDNVENEISLCTTKTGNIAYKKDKLCYKFIPSETAIYFFEVSGEVYPTIELSDSSENSIKFADNIKYEQSNVLSCELIANQNYLIKIGSQTGLSGDVSVYTKKVKVTTSGNNITITGKAGTQSGIRCGLSIYDSAGELVRISQFNTSSGGNFTYSTMLDTASKSYQCIINQANMENPIYFAFGTGTISKEIRKYTKANIAAGANVTPTFSANKISANANMKVDITVKSNNANLQEILAFWVLTTSDGEIQNACGTGSGFSVGQSQVLHMEMQMPSSVNNMNLSLYVWQGKNIDESSYMPLAKTYTLTRYGMSNLSSPTDESADKSEENMSLETDDMQNEYITTEDFLISDIGNEEIKLTSILNKAESAMALTEYDYIDMNFQARCNGKNTGGELQVGKNIITIFYKNKTDSSITFKPVVLWGYYDSNDTFQQTYFQWHEVITLSAKGASNGSDIKAIEYEVEVPQNVEFAAAYWAVDDDYNYVCKNPTALRLEGIYKEQATPMFFEESGGGKFIYCNNREGIKRTDLADSNNPNPKLLMHEKGLPDGKYEMLLFHNNDTSIGIDPNTGNTIQYGNGFPIYLDVQFYDPYGTAQMIINSVGYQIPRGESWACIQGYSDYKQMVITDLAGNNPIYPNTNLGVPYYHDFTSQSSIWIGNRMPRSYYSSVPLSHCVYMVIEFEIVNSQGVEVNVAAFKDNGNFNNRFSDYQAGYNPDVTAPFIKDMQYKGVADTLPLVEAKAIMAFDDDHTSNSNLPVTIFNELEPGGNCVDWWKTNINPQAEQDYANYSDSTGMMYFKYNDPQKLEAYGSAYAGEKDTVWRFDTKHSDTYQYPSSRSSDNDPNYVLPRPSIVSSSGESSNRDVAQNLANYGVVYRYNYEIYNHSTTQRDINIMLETTANNVIVIRNPDNPYGLYYAMYKGESNPMAKDTILSASPAGGGNGIGIITDIVLTTGNAGGMSNSIKIN